MSRDVNTKRRFIYAVEMDQYIEIIANCTTIERAHTKNRRQMNTRDCE